MGYAREYGSSTYYKELRDKVAAELFVQTIDRFPGAEQCINDANEFIETLKKYK